MVQWFPVQNPTVINIHVHVPCRIWTREQFAYEVFIRMPKISPYDNYMYMFLTILKMSGFDMASTISMALACKWYFAGNIRLKYVLLGFFSQLMGKQWELCNVRDKSIIDM